MITFVDNTALSAVQLNSLLQNGSTIDGCVIGSVTPAAGTFTTLSVSGNTVFVTQAVTDNSTKVATTAYVRSVFNTTGSYNPAAVAITGGTANALVIGGSTPAAVTGTAGTFATLTVSGNAVFVTQSAGNNTTLAATTAFVQAAVVAAGTYVPSAVAITGGTANALVLGNVTPAAGTFTTLGSTGAATLASLSVAGAATFVTQPTTDNSTLAATTAYVKAIITASGTYVSTAVNITGGTIAGTTVGIAAPAAASFTSVAMSGGYVVTPRVVSVAGAVTCSATDYSIIIKKTVAAATAITLPASPVAGRMIRIKDGNGVAAANNFTVTPTSGLIDGAANYVMATNYDSIDFQWDGTNWGIV